VLSGTIITPYQFKQLFKAFNRRARLAAAEGESVTRDLSPDEIEYQKLKPGKDPKWQRDHAPLSPEEFLRPYVICKGDYKKMRAIVRPRTMINKPHPSTKILLSARERESLLKLFVEKSAIDESGSAYLAFLEKYGEDRRNWPQLFQEFPKLDLGIPVVDPINYLMTALRFNNNQRRIDSALGDHIRPSMKGPFKLSRDEYEEVLKIFVKRLSPRVYTHEQREKDDEGRNGKPISYYEIFTRYYGTDQSNWPKPLNDPDFIILDTSKDRGSYVIPLDAFYDLVGRYGKNRKNWPVQEKAKYGVEFGEVGYHSDPPDFPKYVPLSQSTAYFERYGDQSNWPKPYNITSLFYPTVESLDESTTRALLEKYGPDNSKWPSEVRRLKPATLYVDAKESDDLIAKFGKDGFSKYFKIQDNVSYQPSTDSDFESGSYVFEEGASGENIPVGPSGPGAITKSERTTRLRKEDRLQQQADRARMEADINKLFGDLAEGQIDKKDIDSAIKLLENSRRKKREQSLDKAISSDRIFQSMIANFGKSLFFILARDYVAEHFDPSKTRSKGGLLKQPPLPRDLASMNPSDINGFLVYMKDLTDRTASQLGMMALSKAARELQNNYTVAPDVLASFILKSYQKQVGLPRKGISRENALSDPNSKTLWQVRPGKVLNNEFEDKTKPDIKRAIKLMLGNIRLQAITHSKSNYVSNTSLLDEYLHLKWQKEEVAKYQAEKKAFDQGNLGKAPSKLKFQFGIKKEKRLARLRRDILSSPLYDFKEAELDAMAGTKLVSTATRLKSLDEQLGGTSSEGDEGSMTALDLLQADPSAEGVNPEAEYERTQANQQIRGMLNGILDRFLKSPIYIKREKEMKAPWKPPAMRLTLILLKNGIGDLRIADTGSDDENDLKQGFEGVKSTKMWELMANDRYELYDLGILRIFKAANDRKFAESQGYISKEMADAAKDAEIDQLSESSPNYSEMADEISQKFDDAQSLSEQRYEYVVDLANQLMDAARLTDSEVVALTEKWGQDASDALSDTKTELVKAFNIWLNNRPDPELDREHRRKYAEARKKFDAEYSAAKAAWDAKTPKERAMQTMIGEKPAILDGLGPAILAEGPDKYSIINQGGLTSEEYDALFSAMGRVNPDADDLQEQISRWSRSSRLLTERIRKTENEILKMKEQLALANAVLENPAVKDLDTYFDLVGETPTDKKRQALKDVEKLIRDREKMVEKVKDLTNDINSKETNLRDLVANINNATLYENLIDIRRLTPFEAADLASTTKAIADQFDAVAYSISKFKFSPAAPSGSELLKGSILVKKEFDIPMGVEIRESLKTEKELSGLEGSSKRFRKMDRPDLGLTGEVSGLLWIRDNLKQRGLEIPQYLEDNIVGAMKALRKELSTQLDIKPFEQLMLPADKYNNLPAEKKDLYVSEDTAQGMTDSEKSRLRKDVNERQLDRIMKEIVPSYPEKGAASLMFDRVQQDIEAFNIRSPSMRGVESPTPFKEGADSKDPFGTYDFIISYVDKSKPQSSDPYRPVYKPIIDKETLVKNRATAALAYVFYGAWKEEAKKRALERQEEDRKEGLIDENAKVADEYMAVFNDSIKELNFKILGRGGKFPAKKIKPLGPDEVFFESESVTYQPPSDADSSDSIIEQTHEGRYIVTKDEELKALVKTLRSDIRAGEPTSELIRSKLKPAVVENRLKALESDPVREADLLALTKDDLLSAGVSREDVGYLLDAIRSDSLSDSGIAKLEPIVTKKREKAARSNPVRRDELISLPNDVYEKALIESGVPEPRKTALDPQRVTFAEFKELTSDDLKKRGLQGDALKSALDSAILALGRKMGRQPSSMRQFGPREQEVEVSLDDKEFDRKAEAVLQSQDNRIEEVQQKKSGLKPKSALPTSVSLPSGGKPPPPKKKLFSSVMKIAARISLE